MTGYDFVECAKRFGGVLAGRTDPSVKAIIAESSAITRITEDRLGGSLIKAYQDIVKEPVPEYMLEALMMLPEDGAPTNGGGHAPR